MVRNDSTHHALTCLSFVQQPKTTDLTTMTISIQGVTFTYPGATTPVLRDLNLEITPGEFVAIIGNNGSGKTSLCKLLTGIIPHFFQGDFEGKVLVSGRDTWETRVADLSSVVGYVYQDFENQLLKPRVLEDVAFAPLNFGYPDYRERAEKALAILGLSELSGRIIWELSGGEQHLIALAGAIALEPENHRGR
ncbi:MAG: ABC transporter ATP-binding protein [Candidatus Promineifilaceae bacterium]